MNIEELRNHCISKKGVTESFPFDEKTLVFKAGGKMFALADIEEFNLINLKCDPERAIELREKYSGVEPGYHMNKTHWNSVRPNMDVDDRLIFDLIDHSYDLIINTLPKKIRDGLQG